MQEQVKEKKEEENMKEWEKTEEDQEGLPYQVKDKRKTTGS